MLQQAAKALCSCLGKKQACELLDHTNHLLKQKIRMLSDRKVMCDIGAEEDMAHLLNQYSLAQAKGCKSKDMGYALKTLEMIRRKQALEALHWRENHHALMRASFEYLLNAHMTFLVQVRRLCNQKPKASDWVLVTIIKES